MCAACRASLNAEPTEATRAAKSEPCRTGMRTVGPTGAVLTVVATTAPLWAARWVARWVAALADTDATAAAWAAPTRPWALRSVPRR
jgi:hypothetical protein